MQNTQNNSPSYNLVGEVISTTDALGQVTTDSYNVDGEETGSKDPLGFGTSSVYDVVGQLIQSTDADGKVTNYYYDADGQQIGVLDPDNNLTQSVYDAAGNLVQSIDARGKVTSTVYDADNRVLLVTDPDGHTSQSIYDKLGNLVQSIDANGKASMTLYDALSRPYLSEDPNGHWTQTSYDGDGEAIASVDGSGDLTQYADDADGEQTGVRNGDGGVTQYTFNNDGQTTSETDAVGNVTSYQLDGYGNVVATASAASGLTQSVYDTDNRLVSTTDALGRKITYAYDHDGRLTTETWYNADGSVANTKTYTYDHNGNMLTAGDNSGTYTMTYDNAGRLLTRKDPNNLTLTYGYDQNNNVTSVADSLGGSITNVYDPASQLTGVQFATSTVQARLDVGYTPDGQVSTLKRYKDTGGTQLVSQSAYSYDSTGNVTEIKHTNASGGVLGDYQYTVYDAANRLSSETDTENGGAPVTTPYSYDAASQLTQAGPNGYTYDLNGNRNMTGYSTGSGNQLTSDGTWNYTYDAVGNTHTKTNIATGETWTFTWNNANQLTQAVDKDKNSNTIQTVTLKYDVFGNLIEEDVQSGSQTTTTRYAYDAAGNVWADLNSTGQLTMRRLYAEVNGQVQPFARIDASGNVAWYLTDHLGSVRLLTDNSATVIDQIDYDAWGNIPTGGETQPGNGDRFKFASGVWDAALGMTRFGVRWVANGHWFSVDPIGLAGGPNPYDYVGNAPTDGIDPSGNIVIFIHGIRDKAAKWTSDMARGLKARWLADNGALERRGNVVTDQRMYLFQWEGKGLGGNPSVFDATDSTLNLTDADTKAVNSLKAFLDELNTYFEKYGVDEPINVIAHSQGTIITLAALREGAKVDTFISLNSPLARKNAAKEVPAALKNIRGHLYNYHSVQDFWAGKVKGGGAWRGGALGYRNPQFEEDRDNINLSDVAPGHSEARTLRFSVKYYADKVGFVLKKREQKTFNKVWMENPVMDGLSFRNAITGALTLARVKEVTPDNPGVTPGDLQKYIEGRE